jgi:hypothetical protein
MNLTGIHLLFALLIGHAIADYPMQSDWMAKNKSHKNFDHWGIVLAMHCLIHGGAVWLFTGSYILGVIEVIVHYFIDILKNLGRIDFAEDQILHIVSKIAYVAVIKFAGIAAFL